MDKVKTWFRSESEKDKERDLMVAITDAVDELARLGSGDVLVFLPGEREIRDAAEAFDAREPYTFARDEK